MPLHSIEVIEKKIQKQNFTLEITQIHFNLEFVDKIELIS